MQKSEMPQPPHNSYEKMKALFEDNDQSLLAIKKEYDAIRARQKQLLKYLSKIEQKALKKQNKPKTTRKPCGFARPSLVSNEMCDFMELPHGSEVSRTDVTKKLIQYIKDHNLQDNTNRRNIIPNETLYQIFGDDARKKQITYFTMQKFMNRHFLKKESNTSV